MALREAEIEARSTEPPPPWTLITSHGLALLYVAAHPNATIREIADELELTERRIADIIRDLIRAGLLTAVRQGRRNQYAVDPQAHFRHRIVKSIPFQAFVKLWGLQPESSEVPSAQ